MIITNKQFLEFIRAQPADRPLDFMHNRTEHDCGCPMVHLGREVLGLDKFACGSDKWFDALTSRTLAEFELDPDLQPQDQAWSRTRGIRRITKLFEREKIASPETYGELQEVIRGLS